MNFRFSIADFGFGAKRNRRSSPQWLDSFFDNQKPKTSPELGRRIKNRKLAGVFAVVFALSLAGTRTEAQQPKKLPRVGYLSSLDSVGESERVEAVRLGLRELGYTEGQNVAIEYRYAEGNVDQASEFAVELVRLKVDIIVVAGGTPWVQAAKNAAKTIPIVMVGGGTDPVKAGLIQSLARPGGNVTGLTFLTEN